MNKIENQDGHRRESEGKTGSAPADAVSASEGKLFAPSSEVEVPRMPAKPDADADTVSPHVEAVSPNAPPVAKPGETSQPTKIDTTESNWADSTQPAPDKRTARSSIL